MTLRNQISSNETIIWEGKKDVKVSILEGIFNPLLPFAIVWLLIDTGFIGVFMGGFVSSGTPALFTLGTAGFFLIHLMPVWLYLFGVLTAGMKAKNTEYLITDRAIYIQTGVFKTVTEMKPFADLSHVTVSQGIFDKMCGTGDVITVCSHVSTTSEGGHSHGMNIDNIKDYESVFRLVKEYQEAIYTDTMYPNDLRPRENHGYNTTYVGSDRRNPWN